jgi:hypothetical protein
LWLRGLVACPSVAEAIRTQRALGRRISPATTIRGALWRLYTFVSAPTPCPLQATDPYSRCTAANGERALILADMGAQDLTPEGWRGAPLPPLAWSDISVYELHIRDFRRGGWREDGDRTQRVRAAIPASHWADFPNAPSSNLSPPTNPNPSLKPIPTPPQPAPQRDRRLCAAAPPRQVSSFQPGPRYRCRRGP